MPDITIRLTIKEVHQSRLIAHLDRRYPKPDGVSYPAHFLNLTKQKWINEILYDEFDINRNSIPIPTPIEID